MHNIWLNLPPNERPCSELRTFQNGQTSDGVVLKPNGLYWR